MIQLKPMGGLGNQLFQVAASYAFSLENKEDFSICSSRHFLPNQGLNIGNYSMNVFKDFNFLEVDDKLSEYKYLEFKYKKIPKGKNLSITGYFQSEKYFKKYKKNILEKFLPTDSIRNEILKEYSPDENSVSIHIRRGDYLKFQDVHPVQDKNYFNQAINMVDGYKKIFIVSDDLEWCMENFSHPLVNFVDEDDYICLYLISMCGCNIGSNSSFSWWGSYLNQHQEKVCIFPKKWFSNKEEKEYQDIFCKNFTLI